MNTRPANRAMSAEVNEPKDMPASPLALHLLCIFYAHEGRYEKAEGAFLRVIAADPEMVGSYVELGLVHACRGEYPKMVEALRRAVSVGPGGVRAYLGERPFGDLGAAGAPETRGQAAPEAEGDAGDVSSILTSATAYMARGRDDEAVVMLERALEGKAENLPALVALLALAYLLRGEGVEADGAGIRRAAAAAGGRARRC